MLTSAFAVGAFALLAAGCGGGGGSPGIASVASSGTTATTSTTTQSGSGPADKAFGGSGGEQGGQFQMAMKIDPGSPAFRSARTVCDKLLPNGGLPTPAQIAQRQQQMLAFSACMRAHGVKDFPDPSNGGIQLHASPGSDLNPNNPTFQKAQQACRGHLPFKIPSGTAKVGSG